MKNKFKVLGLIALLAVIGFSIAACDSDGGGGGGGGGGGYYTPPSITYYTVSFDVGEGSGSAPSSRTVESGTRITLPGQSNMTAPSGKEFAGWRKSGTNYDEGDSYYVNDNVTFTARWTTLSDGGDTQPTNPPSTPSQPGYIFLKNDSVSEDLSSIFIIDAATNVTILLDQDYLLQGQLRRYDNIPGGKSYIVKVRPYGSSSYFSSKSFFLSSGGIIYLKYYAKSVTLQD
jgi:hypothetical protein